MTREVLEAIVDTPSRNPVVCVEDGQVWVSGMNADPFHRAERIRKRLEAAGFEPGEVSDDGAAEHGGLIIPLEEAEELTEEAHKEVVNGGSE